jgi:type IV pilus assembly protein PilV
MRNKAGFTLISVMIAMVLLSVGVLALVRTGGEVMAARTNSAIKINAVAIARGHMEWVRSLPPQDVKTEAVVRVNASGVADGQGHYSRSVTVVQTEATLLEVRVKVDYPRAREPVELITLVYVPPVPT